MVTARGGYFFLSDYGTKWAATHIPAQDTPDEEAATAADEGHAAQDAATPATPRAEDKADEIHPAAGIDGYPQCIIPGA